MTALALALGAAALVCARRAKLAIARGDETWSGVLVPVTIVLAALTFAVLLS